MRLAYPTYRVECSDCLVDPDLIGPDRIHALAEALKTDPALASEARALEPRDDSIPVALGGLAAGAGVAAVGLLRPNQRCGFNSGQLQTCDSSLNVSMLVVGGAIALAGLAGAFVIHQVARPTQAEVVGPLNAWNARHPGQAFTLGPASGRASQASPSKDLTPDLRDGD